MSEQIWWTGPTDEDLVEIKLHPNEVTLWQYRHGNISSVTIDDQTALQIAGFIRQHLDRRN